MVHKTGNVFLFHTRENNYLYMYVRTAAMLACVKKAFSANTSS